MLEFFKPWRRKLGCITLVMACAFMAGWVRGQLVVTQLFSVRATSDDFAFYQSALTRNGLIFCKRIGSNHVVDYEWYHTIPYWSVVLPLTILSAYLLLSKPRPPKPATLVESPTQAPPSSQS
jgi:hypothetical protein